MTEPPTTYQDRAWNRRAGLHVGVFPALAVGALGVLVLTLTGRPDDRTDPGAIAVVVVSLAVFGAVWRRTLRSQAAVAADEIVVTNPFRVVTIPLGGGGVVVVGARALSPKMRCVRFEYHDGGRRRRVTAIAIPESARDDVGRFIHADS